MPEPRKTKIEKSLIVSIVGDGAMAGPTVADGRLLPLLIVDTAGRPDIAELIRVHRHLPSGDVVSQWGGKVEGDDDTVLLSLHFLRPMDLSVALIFSIEKQAMLVEAMLTGGGVYLQAGNGKDRLVTTLDANRMFVELPDGAFGSVWPKLLQDRMTAVTARRLGVSRRKARPAAERLVGEIRRLAAFRMPA